MKPPTFSIAGINLRAVEEVLTSQDQVHGLQGRAG
jgi:hypothetical protein